jgi:hypothetical protein
MRGYWVTLDLAALVASGRRDVPRTGDQINTGLSALFSIFNRQQFPAKPIRRLLVHLRPPRYVYDLHRR